MRGLALEVLRGETPRRLPFITRLEAWYTAHTRRGTIPRRFQGMTLDEVHQATGVGRLKFSVAYGYRMAGVEALATFNGEGLYHQVDPVVENFPGMWDFVPTDRAGVTRTELRTPVGKLTLTHTLLEEGVAAGTDPYLSEHLIKGDADLPVLEYILERAELVLFDQKIQTQWDEIGEEGLLVPLLQRIPFQQILLEYLGETGLFFSLYDNPKLVHRLLELLDTQMAAALACLAELDVPYVEFPDNLHGLMTNPKLFREYCLPSYHKYVEILHGQGKKIGSHTDGNIRPLLKLLAESGLDVCESVSPAPLTPCPFKEINQAGRGRPLIWGALPTPVLEEGTREEDFRAYLADLLSSIDQPLILGLVDLFMYHNSIERVETIAEQLAGLDVQDRIKPARGKLL